MCDNINNVHIPLAYYWLYTTPNGMHDMSHSFLSWYGFHNLSLSLFAFVKCVCAFLLALCFEINFYRCHIRFKVFHRKSPSMRKLSMNDNSILHRIIKLAYFKHETIALKMRWKLGNYGEEIQINLKRHLWSFHVLIFGFFFGWH